MKKLFQFIVGILLFGLIAFPAQATFSSIYIFGDGVCTTTTNRVAGLTYYGLRNSNGRIWVEVLAQQLGLTNNYWYSTNGSIHVSYTNLSASTTNWSYSSNNWSYFGQYSSNLVTYLKTFAAPADASNALFIVWVNDADFVNDMGKIYPSTNIVTWTNAINSSLTNHYTIITNLYAKGARTLVMPNAVDITEIPQYDNLSSANKNFIRQMAIGFNTAFTTWLSNAMISLPGLKIYEPDVFTLLDNMLANSANYGLTNVLYGGQSTGCYRGRSGHVIEWIGDKLDFLGCGESDCEIPCRVSWRRPPTSFAAANQSNHITEWHQPVGRGQRAGWLKWFRKWQHGFNELDFRDQH